MNKEEKKVYMKAYYEKNKDEIRAYMKAYNKTYCEEHKEEIKIKKAKYHVIHKEKQNENSRRNCYKYKKICVNEYGLSGGCVCCGETELSFLSIDHIKDNGARDREIHGSGTSFFLWLIKNNFPEGFQTLCCNCQMGKRCGNGFCPHYPEIDLRISKESSCQKVA